MDKQFYIPKTKAPKLLYHASQNKNILEFIPSKEHYRDFYEGPVVFATPDKVYAKLFLVRTSDDWTTLGRYTDGGRVGPWHIIISDRHRFEEADVGGTVYWLDPKDFSFDPHKNMGNLEWTSKTTVKPIGKEDYSSGLVAMKEAGIEVYFVDKETYAAINISKDHGKSIIDTLTPEV
ncbi:MAG: hypothetical protein U0516_03520 [Candidatus Saccharibacteria bacterium]